MGSFVRLSVNLPREVMARLKDYASRKSISVTESIRHAIRILKFIEVLQDKNKPLVVVEKDGTRKDVYFL